MKPIYGLLSTVACLQLVMVIRRAIFISYRDSYWPGGVLAETSPERKKDVKVRTRMAAKTKMFGSIPGELSYKALAHPLQFSYYF